MPVGTSNSNSEGFGSHEYRDRGQGDSDLILASQYDIPENAPDENEALVTKPNHSDVNTATNGVQRIEIGCKVKDSNGIDHNENNCMHIGNTDQNSPNGVNDEDDVNGENDETDTRELIDIVGDSELVYQEHCLRSRGEETNDVTGMAVTKYNCQMLLCDHGNGIIKLVDRFFNTIFKYYSCFKPFGVAVLDTDFFVVTYPFVRLMQYFKFKGGNSKFAPWFPVKAQNEYYGVCGVKDRIVTVCKYDGDNLKDIPSVHILNREGMVLHIINKNADGEPLFVDPEHVAIHSNTRLVYASDRGAGKVVCLNLAGDVLSLFCTNEFNPTGISVDDSKGWVYVSDRCKERIIKLNQELEPVQKIFAKCDTMPLLLASMYCSKSDRLIVSLEESVYLKSFVV